MLKMQKERDALFFVFTPVAHGGVEQDCKYQEADYKYQIKNHNLISWCHCLTPFIKNMLNIQNTAVASDPERNLKMLKLKGDIKNGTTRNAKSTSPITINMSDSLSNCASENSIFMENNDTIVNSVKSRV